MKIRSLRILGAGLLLPALNADAFDISHTDPQHALTSVPRDANIAAEFDEALSNETVNAYTFRVWGKQSGFKSGALSFDPLSFNPDTDFLAGEEVFATWSTNILSAAGSPLTQRQIQFYAEAGGASSFRMSERLDSGMGIGTRFAALGDLDNDGDLDVFGADFSVPIRVSLNDGTARFTKTGQSPNALGCWKAALGDIDGDGDLDAFVARILNIQSQIYFNDGTGQYTLSAQTFGGYATTGAAFGDIDGDGDLDLVTSEHGTVYASPHNWVLLNDGSGFFTAVQILGSYADDVALGDLEGDGDLDVVFAGTSTPVWFNDGSGFFVATSQPGIGGTTVVLGDLNGDSILDAVVGSVSNAVYLNDQFGQLVPMNQPMGSLFRPALADLDGDHDLDVVNGGSGVWLNDGSGLFALAGMPLTSNSEVRLGDFDGDGDVDILRNADSDGFKITKLYLNKQGMDIAISKVASTNLALAGQTITFTVTVYSVGSTVATGVVISDPLPAGLIYAGDNAGGAYNPTNGLWTIGSLAPGTNTNLVVQATVATNAANGARTNVASLAAMDATDTDPLDNEGRALVQVATVLADLSLSVADTPDPVPVGCRLNYTVQLLNRGPRAATNVVIVSTLPTNASLLSVISTDTVCVASNPVTCVAAQLSSGQTARIVISVQPTSEGPATMFASATTEATFDMVPSDNSSTVLTTIAGTVINSQSPALAAPGSPVITSDPAGSPQNNVGDAFDFNPSGVDLHMVDQCGFGNLGQIYFNYDATRLYVGGVGLNPAGGNNAVVIFLGLDSLTNDAVSLVGRSGLPLGLDLMKNIYFSQPMDIAILLGDEYGDGTYPNFVLSDNATDFGQGVFHIRPNVFQSVAGALISQFDGNGTNGTVLVDDDGDRITERWEVGIPWASVGAANISAVHTVYVAGVVSGGTSGDRRFISGNFLGAGAVSQPLADAFNNYGFADVTITPLRLEQSGDDLDADQLPNGWESQYFSSLTGAEPAVDNDLDGYQNADEFIALTDPTDGASFFMVTAISNLPSVSFPSSTSRVYGLLSSTNLLDGAWQEIQSEVPGSNAISSLADTNPPPSAIYRVTVKIPAP